jgi:hypothetical protein
MHGIPARDAARPQGYEVLLADKASFPSDIISTHYISPAGCRPAQAMGLLDAVRSSNCPPIPGLLFDLGPFALRDRRRQWMV